MPKLTYSYIMQELIGATPVRRRSLIVEADEGTPDRSQYASTAAWQAAVLKLTHGGFGRYVDINGNYVARSVPQGDDMVLVKITGAEANADDSTKSADGKVDLAPDEQDPNAIGEDRSKATRQIMKDLAADPEKFKEVLQYVFQHEAKRRDKYSKTVATYKKKDGTVEKLFNVKDLNIPGLVTNGQGRPTPSHILIGHQAIPLRVAGEYDLTDLAKQIAKEYQPPAPKVAAAKTDTPTDKPEKPAPPARVGPDRAATTDDVVSALNYNLDNFLNQDPSGGRVASIRAKRFTPEKGEKIKVATQDVMNFIQNPTRDAAIALVEKYDIRVNTSHKEISFDSLASLNDAPIEGSKDREDFEYFFDSSKELVNLAARGKPHSQSLRMAIINSLKTTLGDEFTDVVRSNVRFKDLINPSNLFSKVPQADLTAKKVKMTSGADAFEVDGMQFPIFFEYNDPDLNRTVPQFINEAATLDEQLRRRSGVPLDQENPELDAKAKDISDSVLLYQKRLKYFETIKDSWIKFDGRAQLPDVVATLKEGIKTQALRAKEVTLTPEELEFLDTLEIFNAVDPNMSDAENDLDFKSKWTAFANRLVTMPNLNQIRSSLAETMVVIRELRKDKKSYIPLKSNVKTIDAIGLSDMTNFSASTVDELLDVEDNVRLLMSSIDLVSVKSSLTAKTKVSGETAADESGGAAPAISGLLEVCEVDPQINKKYVDFFRAGNAISPDDATSLIAEMLNDASLVDMLYEYYEVPPTPKVPDKRMRDLKKIMLSAKGLGNKTYEQKALLGKIGECILNRGTQFQMFQNVTLSNRDVRESNSKDSVVAFRFVGDDKGLGSFKFKIAAQVSPEDARRVGTIDTPTTDRDAWQDDMAALRAKMGMPEPKPVSQDFIDRQLKKVRKQTN